MFRLVSRAAAAAVLLLAAAVAAPAADTVELRWQFKKGQVLKYLFKNREVRTVAVGDQKFETTTSAEYDLEWAVQDVDDQGTATLGQKITGLRLTCNGKDFDFQYDSARGNEADDDYKKKLINFCDQLRFAKYRLKLRRDGRVAEVYGFDKLIGEVGNLDHVVDMHGLGLHDASFGWLLQLTLGGLPERPAAAGAKWQVPAPAKLSGFGALTGQTDLTLARAGAGEPAQVKLAGSHALELDMTWAGASLRGTLKTSKLAGTVRFDPRTASVPKGEAQADFGGDLKLGLGDSPVDLKVTFQETLDLEARR
jgi:hypothetical protein